MTMVKILREKSIKEYIKEGVERNGYDVISVKIDIDKGFDGGNPNDYQPISLSAVVKIEEPKGDKIWTDKPPTLIGWYGAFRSNSEQPDIYYFDGQMMRQGNKACWALSNFKRFTRKSVQPW